MISMENTCVDCAVINCQRQDRSYPEFCPTEKLTENDINDIIKLYDEDNNKEVSRISAEIESDFYCTSPESRRQSSLLKC